MNFLPTLKGAFSKKSILIVTNVILFLIDATERPDSISILDGLSKEDYQYPDSPVEIVMAGKICISSNLASLQALYKQY